MTNINFDRLEEIVLLFFDNEDNYNSSTTQNKIGNSFKNKHLLKNKDDFEKYLSEYDDNQDFIIFIHISSSKDNAGYYKFKDSKISHFYPNLRYYYISSTQRKEITIQDSKIDVFSYDGLHEKIDKMFIPQSRKEILHKNEHNFKEGIFLSHSSKDRDIVLKFKELILELGLGVDSENIKFTSIEEDCGEKGGINISEDLHGFLLNKTGFFIQFLSDDYKKSETCLNEEGAAWVLLDDLMFLPVLLPKVSSKKISWIKNLNKGIKITESDSLINIYNNRKYFFGNVDFSKLNRKIKEFIEWVETSYPA